jgi:glycosyltransferase involved in cell wall biosynthesis
LPRLTPLQSVARRRRWTIVQLLPALEPGGAERSALEVAQALVAAGHRSIVISAGGRWVARLTQQGSEHFKLPIGKKSWAAIGSIWSLRRLLRKIRPDVVHVRSRLPAWIAHFAIKGLDFPIHRVSTVHGLYSVGAYSRIMVRAERVIAVSEVTRKYLVENYPDLDTESIRVIPRGVDIERYPRGYQPDQGWMQTFYAEFPMLRGGVLLTLPGRGTRLKGHAQAIELLAALRNRGIDARLLLVGVIEAGRERYRAELQELAAALGVRGALALSRARGDLPEIYAVSDLILQLSTRPESFGRVVLEALAMGKPVLGHGVGGVGEQLRSYFPEGLVENGGVDALAERAIRILESGAVPAVAKLPSTSELQRLTLSVYAELIEGRPPDPVFAARGR